MIDKIDKIDKLLKNEGLRRAGSFEAGWNVTLWIDNTAVVVWATDAPILVDTGGSGYSYARP